MIGEGGAGIVYEAYDRERSESVALKRLKVVSHDAVYRLKREFRGIADLDHPNVVKLYDLVVDDDHGAFFTMELVHGRTFFDFIEQRARPMSDASIHDLHDTINEGIDTPACNVQRLLDTIGPLAAGIDAIHETGLLHRDIKPGNVMVDGQQRPVLLDFGLTAAQGALEHESLRGVVGTVAYMSPEQAGGRQDLTPASDWYALGVILYEALTGQLPFGGSVIQVLTGKQVRDPKPLLELVRDVPSRLSEVCMALLSRRPDARPSMREVLEIFAQPALRIDSQVIPVVREDEQFVGRRDELRALHDATLKSQSARDLVIVPVTGMSGVGKTALVKYFLSIVARQRDTIVLKGRAYEREHVPFAALDEAIDQLSHVWKEMPTRAAVELLPRSPNALAEGFPVLGRVPVVRDAPYIQHRGDTHARRAARVDALRQVLQRMGDRYNVVVFLDDMQWVDAESVELLDELLRGHDRPRMTLILSSWLPWHWQKRSDSSTPTERRDTTRGASDAYEALQSLLGRVDCETIGLEVHPMKDVDAATLVSHLFPDSSTALRERILRESMGVPFWIAELSRRDDMQDVSDAAMLSMDDLLMGRLNRLSELELKTLQYLALTGAPLNSSLLRRALDASRASFTAALMNLRKARLVQSSGRHADGHTLSTSHARIQRLLRRQCPKDERIKVHRSLAELLEVEPNTAPELVAQHWEGAGEPAKAAEFAIRTAEEALSRLQFVRAAEAYRWALSLGDFTEDERTDLAAAQASALGQAGHVREAAMLYREAAERAEFAKQLQWTRQSAELLLRAGFIEEGIDALSPVLESAQIKAARPGVWLGLRTRQERRRLHRLVRQRRRTHEHAKAPWGSRAALDVSWTLGAGLVMTDPRRAEPHLYEALSHSLALHDPSRVIAIAICLMDLCRLRGARDEFQRIADIARPYMKGASTQTKAIHAIERGCKKSMALQPGATLPHAIEDFDEAVHTLVSSGHGYSSAGLIAVEQLTTTLLHAGQLTRLQGVLEDFARQAEQRSLMQLDLDLRGRLALGWFGPEGDWDSVRKRLSNRFARWERDLAKLPPLQQLGVAIGRTTIALSLRAEQADDSVSPIDDWVRLEQELGVIASVLKPFAEPMVSLLFARARLALAIGLAESASSGVGRARAYARQLSACTHPLAKGKARLIEAACAAIAGDVPASSNALSEARHIFHRRGALLLLWLAERLERHLSLARLPREDTTTRRALSIAPANDAPVVRLDMPLKPERFALLMLPWPK